VRQKVELTASMRIQRKDLLDHVLGLEWVGEGTLVRRKKE
jgi:hypothetical protein